MMSKLTKQTLSIVTVLCSLIVLSVACNNAADASRAGTDTTAKMTDTGAGMMPATTNKMDTMKMDTASTRPVKTTN